VKRAFRFVQAFKVKDGEHEAWCRQCGWDREGTAAQASRAARYHTELTGHETRIEVRRQRGFRVIVQDFRDDPEGVIFGEGVLEGEKTARVLAELARGARSGAPPGLLAAAVSGDALAAGGRALRVRVEV